MESYWKVDIRDQSSQVVDPAANHEARFVNLERQFFAATTEGQGSNLRMFAFLDRASIPNRNHKLLIRSAAKQLDFGTKALPFGGRCLQSDFLAASKRLD